MPRITAVIPARMASSRFPGKPLEPLLGRSMLEHVYRRTAACVSVDEVIVATCDEEIRQAAVTFGAQAVMTSADHECASDRVAEAATDRGADIVVMVQGDEPLVNPDAITKAVAPMLVDPDVQCVNLAGVVRSIDELRDLNTIKVVMDRNGDALLFSREVIPSMRDQPFHQGGWFKQICVIPFRYDALVRFANLLPTPLEIAESIDMLRFLEHGILVRMVETDLETHAVDTPGDLLLVESLLASDPYTATYTEVA